MRNKPLVRQPARVRELISWLRDDLFIEEAYDGNDRTLRAFRNPGGYRVVLAPSASGWIENPDGSMRLVSSGLDVATLDEYLP